MKKLIEFWEKTSGKINSLAMRERVLVGLSLMAAVYMFWDFAFFQGVVTEETLLNKRLKEAGRELTKLTAEEKILAKALTNDPNAAKRREIVRLEKRLEMLDKELHEISAGLIEAEKLPEILHDVLKISKGITLVGMKTHKAEPLPFPEAINRFVEEEESKGKDKTQKSKDSSQNNDDVSAEDISVFKHSVTIHIEGSYFDVVGYLNKLEGLPWRFYWEFIDYGVSRYPKAEVKLQVYTLSTELGVLSV